MMTTKLYQIDTYLKEWDARILAAKPAPEVPGGSAKQTAGGSADASLQTCYLIQLDQTAFFPEGGGQGADHGKLRLIGSDSEAVFSVIDVQEDGDLIWHTVCLPDPADGSSEPIGELCTILSEGCKVHCVLDWDRRFEHMQRHCGEHILSGAFYRLFGGANHGFHMGQDYMTIEMARQAELLANQVIWDDLPVSVSYFDTRQEAEQLPLRKALTFDEAISIVTIGKLSETSDTAPADCVACCGTHPSTTGQVGLIKIYKVEKYKDMTRIYCDAGRKALTDYQRKHEILTDLSNRYSASVEEFPEKLRIQEEKTAAIRNELHHLKKTYIESESAKLDASLEKVGSDAAGSSGTMGGNIDSDTPVILYPLSLLSMDDAFTMAKPYMGKVRAGQSHPLLLLYVEKEHSCVLVSDGTVHCGKLVREYASFYNGKGGGNDVSAQAIFTSDEDARLFADLLSKHLR